MQVVQMQVVNYVQVMADDYGLGIGPDGTYYRINGNEFEPIGAKDVVMEYIERGARIPDEFASAREIVSKLLN